MGGTSTAVKDIAIINGALSACGGLAVILSSVMIPQLRKQLSRGRMLLLMLSFCDMCQGIQFMLTGSYSTETGSASCVIFGSLGIIASVSSFIATAWVSWWVHHTIKHPELPTPILMPFITTISYPLVTLTGLFIYAAVHWHGDGIGWRQVFEETQDFPWCFIADHPTTDMFIWRIIVEYIPLIASMIVTAIYYITSIRHIKKQAALQCIRESPEIIALERKFLIIIVAYIIIRLPGVIARLYNMGSSSDHVAGFLQIMTVLGDPSQGLVNGVVFTLGTRVVRDKLFSICFYTSKNSEEPDTPQGGPLNHRGGEINEQPARSPRERPKSLVLTGQNKVLESAPLLSTSVKREPTPANLSHTFAESAPLLGQSGKK